MNNIELNDDELAYVVAAIGRVSDPPNLPLYERLKRDCDLATLISAAEYYDHIEFSLPQHRILR